MQRLNGNNIGTIGKRITGKLADELLFPKAAIPGIGSVEVLGREQAVIHGCRGITEFDGDEIILRMSGHLLRISGFSLSVRSFSAGCADIIGTINSFEFIGAGL